MRSAAFADFNAIRKSFPTADYVAPYTIFDVGGNKYRVIVVIHYNRRRVYIRYVFTHAAYDRWSDERRKRKNEEETMTNAAASSIDAAWREFQKAAPVKLRTIRSERHYRDMVGFMNELLDEIGDRKNHPLMGLLDIVSGFVDDYEKRNVKLPDADPAAALGFLMEQHALRQVDLAGLFGSQSNVSEVLSGKREINARQARELAKRFGVTSAAFI